MTFPVEDPPKGICVSCSERCVAQWTDFGIGPYEFWGAKGVHHEWAWASPCCEAPVEEVFEDEDDE